MKFIWLTILFFAVPAYAQRAPQDRQNLTSEAPEKIIKAQELIKQARAAIGQAKAVDSIGSFSATGKLRRASLMIFGGEMSSVLGGDIDSAALGAQQFKEIFVESQFQFDLQLPSRFRKYEKMRMAERRSDEKTIILNEENVWINSRGKYVFGGNQEFFRNMQRAEFIPYTIGFLLTAPNSFPLQYIYVEATTIENQSAEIVAITGPSNFRANLYLDSKTHLPLRLRLILRGTDHPAMAVMQPGTAPGQSFNILDESEKVNESKPQSSQEREKLIKFEDYRIVEGRIFPHRITTLVNGKWREEFQVSKININPSLKPEIFIEKK